MTTSRDRILAVLRREVPDQVPVVPDEAFMMPARFTGEPFWEVFVNDDPPLWRAKISLQERFGHDLILYRELLGPGADESARELSKACFFEVSAMRTGTSLGRREY